MLAWKRFFFCFFSKGTFWLTWSIKNTGAFSKWALFRLSTFWLFYKHFCFHTVAIKQSGQVSPKKFLRDFCFLIFFYFFTCHTFNWNNLKEWWWCQDFTYNCIRVDSINNPAQFHCYQELIKSHASKLCISPKNLCLLATCETSAKEWQIKPQIRVARKTTKTCPKEEVEEQNNYADTEKRDSLIF